jgi:hypothetical protein
LDRWGGSWLLPIWSFLKMFFILSFFPLSLIQLTQSEIRITFQL